MAKRIWALLLAAVLCMTPVFTTIAIAEGSSEEATKQSASQAQEPELEPESPVDEQSGQEPEEEEATLEEQTEEEAAPEEQTEEERQGAVPPAPIDGSVLPDNYAELTKELTLGDNRVTLQPGYTYFIYTVEAEASVRFETVGDETTWAYLFSNAAERACAVARGSSGSFALSYPAQEGATLILAVGLVGEDPAKVTLRVTETEISADTSEESPDGIVKMAVEELSLSATAEAELSLSAATDTVKVNVMFTEFPYGTISGSEPGVYESGDKIYLNFLVNRNLYDEDKQAYFTYVPGKWAVEIDDEPYEKVNKRYGYTAQYRDSDYEFGFTYTLPHLDADYDIRFTVEGSKLLQPEGFQVTATNPYATSWQGYTWFQWNEDENASYYEGYLWEYQPKKKAWVVASYFSTKNNGWAYHWPINITGFPWLEEGVRYAIEVYAVTNERMYSPPGIFEVILGLNGLSALLSPRDPDEMILYWDELVGPTGYEVQFSTVKTFPNDPSKTQTYTVSPNAQGEIATFYRNTNVIPGTTYYARVRALGNNNEKGNYSNVVSGKTSWQTTLSATSTINTIQLAWTHLESANAMTYDVYGSENAKDLNVKGDLPAALKLNAAPIDDKTYFDHTTAQAGKKYTYVVESTLQIGGQTVKIRSKTVSAQLKWPQVTLSAIVKDYKTVQLIWNDVFFGETVTGADYRVMVGDKAKGTFVPVTSNITIAPIAGTGKMSATLENVKTGITKYYYVLPVIGSDQAGIASATISVTPKISKLKLSVSLEGYGLVTAKWNLPANEHDTLDGYQISYATNKKGPFFETANTFAFDGNETNGTETIQVPIADKPVTYYFTVRAVGDLQNPNATAGPASDAKAIKVSWTAPTLKAVPSGKTNAYLSWTKQKNEKGYRIYRQSPGEKEFIPIYGSDGVTPRLFVSETSYLDEGLAPGKTYAYKLRAVAEADVGGDIEGPYSGVKKVKIGWIKPTPKIVKYTIDEIIISWPKDPSVVEYIVSWIDDGYEVGEGDSLTGAQIASDPVVWMVTDLGEILNARHTYKITARAADGDTISSMITGRVTKPAVKNVKSQLTDDGVLLTWDKVAENSIYDVYVATKKGGPYDWVGETFSTSYLDKRPFLGIPSYYKIGVSYWSDLLEDFWEVSGNTQTLVPVPVPQAPHVVRLSRGGNRIMWSQPARNDKTFEYEVSYSTNGKTYKVLQGYTGYNAATKEFYLDHTGVTLQTNAQYRVRAKLRIGNKYVYSAYVPITNYSTEW